MSDSYQIPDETAPAKSFVGAPTFLDVFDGSLYEMLPEGLREIEEAQGTGMLNRLLLRPQELMTQYQQKAWATTLLTSASKIPDQLVPYLLELVGFGAQSGQASTIAQDLSTSARRKLIKIAVPFWKKRGRRDALEAALQIASGLRPAIDTWFDIRTILGESVIGTSGVGLDSWLLWSSLDYVPSAGTDWADHAISVRVCGIDSTERDFVAGIARLCRAIGEAIEIAYVDFIDLMRDGRIAHWVALDHPVAGPGSVTPSVWAAATRTPSPTPAGLVFSPTTREQLRYGSSSTWADPTIETILLPELGTTGTIVLLWNVPQGDSADTNGLAIQLRFETNEISVGSYTGGSFFESYTDTSGISSGEPMGVRIESTTVGVDVHVRLYLNGSLRFSETFAHAGYTSGTLEVVAFDVTFRLCRTEIWQRPLQTLLISPETP